MSDPKLSILREGCFAYFECGGDCVNGPVSLLAGYVFQLRNPFSLAQNLFPQAGSVTAPVGLSLLRGRTVFGISSFHNPTSDGLDLLRCEIGSPWFRTVSRLGGSKCLCGMHHKAPPSHPTISDYR
jgi:Squalene epoxidase